MSRITRLDPTVANQIAAGEVVERPASVVKELVENALDAQARHLRVTFDDGGSRVIAVDDDGSGMDPDDVRLSVERHATSKIRQLDDLDNLNSLGFRGEALAAIGAVSHLTVASRVESEPYGWRVVLEQGRVVDEGPLARARGTRVDCRDLFAQFPARRKALKSPGAELGAAHQLIANVAVAYPEVALTLVADGKTLLTTPGTGSVSRVIQEIGGPEMAEALIPMAGEALGGGVRVSGWILPPQWARGNRQHQVIAINRRLVKNFSLRAAVEQAYGSMLPDRRFPLFWIAVEIPGEDVDPNAHPTKAEVRLHRERVVAGLLHTAVRQSLRQHRSFAFDPIENPVGAPGNDRTRAADVAQTSWTWDTPDDSIPVLHREIAELIPLAQWAARYILAQGPQGLYLIDQHAAHERVYYDRFRRNVHDMQLAQPLLLPLPITLTPAEWEAFQQHADELSQAGFRIDDLGGTTLVLREVPLAVADVADLSFVGHLLQSLLGQGWHSQHPISWATDSLLATAACKAAVKSSRGLSRQEMDALIAEMAGTDSPRSCPHGRPTILTLTLEEVDRRFGRR